MSHFTNETEIHKEVKFVQTGKIVDWARTHIWINVFFDSFTYLVVCIITNIILVEDNTVVIKTEK